MVYRLKVKIDAQYGGVEMELVDMRRSVAVSNAEVA